MLVIAPPVKIAPGFEPLADSHLPVSGFFTYCPPLTTGVLLLFSPPVTSGACFVPFRLSAPFWNPSNAFLLVIAPPVKIAPGFDPLADSHLPVSGFFTYPPTATFSVLPFTDPFPPVTSGVFLVFGSVTTFPFILPPSTVSGFLISGTGSFTGGSVVGSFSSGTLLPPLSTTPLLGCGDVLISG